MNLAPNEKSNHCWLCGRFLSEFPKNYDYVNFELGVGLAEVHETCLQNTLYPYINYNEAMKRHIKFLEMGLIKI